MVIPFYMVAIFEKISGLADFTVQSLLDKYMAYTIVGLLIIFLTNKYLLRNTWRVFVSDKGSLLLDISLGFLFLIIMYLVFSIGNVTYARWFTAETDQTAISNTLREIFSSPVYTVLFLGPFIWISESFMVISRAFILNNLWELSSSKTWAWVSVIATAMLCSLTQWDNGIPGMINWFLIFLAANTLYFKYRRVYPLLIAGVLLQSIGLVSFWVYKL